MTSRGLYEAVQIEINKENAPNLLLEDFNHYANKVLYQYINKRYNIYDINQQTTDDLRVLKATTKLVPQKVDDYNSLSTTGNTATYYVDLPSDYLHLLNCICVYNVKKTYKCYNAGDTWRAAATRLTADAYSQVLDNFWFKPSYKRPYYYIHNINQYTTNPTNPYDSSSKKGTDISSIESREEETDIPKDWKGISTISLRKSQDPEVIDKYSNIQKAAGVRYGNVSKVRLEIRYGTDNSIFTLDQKEDNDEYINPVDPNDPSKGSKGGWVYIDYIKTPQHIRLTQAQLDKTEDTSQVLEFPDYVCQEIVNELVHVIMERDSDARLQTHPVVSQSIANPAQAQAPQQAEG